MIVNKYNNGGGSSSGGTDLTNYWNSAITQTHIDSAASMTFDSAVTYTDNAVSGLASEEYVQNALSGVSLDGYYTSAQTDAAITEAVSGKADAKILVDFDHTSQAERAALYADLYDLYDGGSGATINRNYDFYKTVNTWQGLKIDYYGFSGSTLVFGKVVSPENLTDEVVYEQVVVIDSEGNVEVVTNIVGGASGDTDTEILKASNKTAAELEEGDVVAVYKPLVITQLGITTAQTDDFFYTESGGTQFYIDNTASTAYTEENPANLATAGLAYRSGSTIISVPYYVFLYDNASGNTCIKVKQVSGDTEYVFTFTGGDYTARIEEYPEFYLGGRDTGLHYKYFLFGFQENTEAISHGLYFGFEDIGLRMKIGNSLDRLVSYNDIAKLKSEVGQKVSWSNLAAYTPTSGFSTINGSAITEGGNIVIVGGGEISDPTILKSVQEFSSAATDGDVQSKISVTPGGLPSGVTFVTGNTYGPNQDQYGGTLTIPIGFAAGTTDQNPIYLLGYTDGMFDSAHTLSVFENEWLTGGVVLYLDNETILISMGPDGDSAGETYESNMVFDYQYTAPSDTVMVVNIYADVTPSTPGVSDPTFDVPQEATVYDGLYAKSGNTWMNIIPDMTQYTPTSGFATVNGSAITNGGNIVIQGGGGGDADYDNPRMPHIMLANDDTESIKSALFDTSNGDQTSYMWLKDVTFGDIYNLDWLDVRDNGADFTIDTNELVAYIEDIPAGSYTISFDKSGPGDNFDSAFTIHYFSKEYQQYITASTESAWEFWTDNTDNGVSGYWKDRASATFYIGKDMEGWLTWTFPKDVARFEIRIADEGMGEYLSINTTYKEYAQASELASSGYLYYYYDNEDPMEPGYKTNLGDSGVYDFLKGNDGDGYSVDPPQLVDYDAYDSGSAGTPPFPKHIVTIYRSDYDDLVNNGNEDSETFYIVLPDPE